VTVPALQQPQWADRDALQAAVRRLEGLPPLVLAAECDLRQRYETACGPRLNRSQSLDLAFRVADLYRSPGPNTLGWRP
jgi:3-deoxy-D-arabino-heptulosonate 7-phosphate (DAHP) synthase class II